MTIVVASLGVLLCLAVALDGRSIGERAWSSLLRRLLLAAIAFATLGTVAVVFVHLAHSAVSLAGYGAPSAAAPAGGSWGSAGGGVTPKLDALAIGCGLGMIALSAVAVGLSHLGAGTSAKRPAPPLGFGSLFGGLQRGPKQVPDGRA